MSVDSFCLRVKAASSWCHCGGAAQGQKLVLLADCSGWLQMNILSPVQVSGDWGTRAAAAAAPVLTATPHDRSLAKRVSSALILSL